MPYRAPMAAASLVITRRRSLSLLVGLGALSVGARAQAERPVRIICSSSPGSGTDAAARALQSGLAPVLGAPVVVENMAGASGLIAMQTLARAIPNDMTFVVAPNNVVILPSVMKSFTFDLARDFTPVTILVSIPMVLVANAAKVPAGNAKEFIALLKSNPSALNFGSSGIGSANHMAIELLLHEAAAKATHVPFRGPTPMLAALLGGQIEFGALAMSQAGEHIKTGVLHAIGVFSAEGIEPSIPSFVDQGLPNCVAEAWVALLGPKQMEAAALAKMYESVAAALNDPATKDLLIKQGTIIRVTSPDETRKTILNDQIKYASLVKEIGLTPQ